MSESAENPEPTKSPLASQNPGSAPRPKPIPPAAAAAEAEPFRPFDLARLELTKLRLEDGVALETIFQHLTETAAQALNVERVGVWLMVDRKRALRCVDLFERTKNEHSAGITIRAHDFPEYFEVLEKRKTLPAEVAQTDARTSALTEAYLVPLGITSMLDAPILIGGEVVGVVCHEHIGPPREWSTEERDFAGSMADILALKMKAAEMQDARIALQTQAAQLAESRRMDSLAELAGGVAHDFNNILTVMIGTAELIAADGAASKSITERAQQISHAGQRGVALVKELMSYSRPGPASSRIVRPAEILMAQLPLLESVAGSQHTVRLDVRAAEGRALISPTQLERAVLNLVTNARQAMPDGGEIDVTVDDVEERDEDGKRGRFVAISVVDHGSGIPDHVLPRIFDPFFTTKPRGEGSGLGLAVVHQVVSHAGGFVRVETTVGTGTTFKMCFPRVRG